MELGLKDKVALITGGGRGIGRQIALTLAEEGVKVAVIDFYEKRAQGVADEIKKAGGAAVVVRADVTDLEQTKTMAQKVADEWGRIDILCNNAGNRGIVDPSKKERIGGKLERDESHPLVTIYGSKFFWGFELHQGRAGLYDQTELWQDY